MKTRNYRPQTNPQRRGYILVMFVICALTLIAMLGLVIDGGLLMTSQRQGQNAADAAARACAVAVRSWESTNGNTNIPLANLRVIAKRYAFEAGYNNVPTTADNQGTVVDESLSWLVVNHPPLTGPYAAIAAVPNDPATPLVDESRPAIPANPRYVEVIVTYPLTTAFIQVVGIARDQQVASRGVAGYEIEDRSAGLVVLDPDPENGSGLKISGGGTVTVRDEAGNPANVYVYSLHAGFDGSGGITAGPTIIGPGQQAAKVTGNATFIAGEVWVSGGVNDEAAFSAPNVKELHAGTESPVYDPFYHEGELLPVPTTLNGVLNRDLGSVSINGPKEAQAGSLVPPNVWVENPGETGKNSDRSGTVTLYPGIYHEIGVNGGAVRLKPGIYVLQPTGNGTSILSISSDPTVTTVAGIVGEGAGIGGTGAYTAATPAGVMFYNTGHDYNPAPPGNPDVADEGFDTDVQPSSTSKFFRGIKITGGTVNLSGLVGSGISEPFNKILFYQRRANDQTIQINADNVSSTLTGTFYAKWAELQLGGKGVYNFAIVVGELTVSGGAIITINDTLPYPPEIQLVYLVE